MVHLFYEGKKAFNICACANYCSGVVAGGSVAGGSVVVMEPPEVPEAMALALVPQGGGAL